MRNSSYSGFFKLPMEKRLSEVAEFASLTEKREEYYPRQIPLTRTRQTI